MQYTGLQVFSFLVLLIGTGLVVVSIATNYWSYHTYEAESTEIAIPSLRWHNGRRGLWEQCDNQFVSVEKVQAVVGLTTKPEEEKCVNRYSELINSIVEGEQSDRIYSKFSIWEVACLALMCASAVLGIFMLLFSPCCCTRCPCCLSVWVLLAALHAAAGVALYVYYQQTGQAVGVKNDNMPFAIVLKPTGYGYSFWCAVAGAACQLIASILFAVSRARTHSYSHTI